MQALFVLVFIIIAIGLWTAIPIFALLVGTGLAAIVLWNMMKL